MDEIYQRRVLLIEFVVEQGVSLTEACRRIGISRTTGYKVVQRFNDDGYEGLRIKSSAPGTTPKKISDTLKRRVIVKSLNYPSKGPKWISTELKNEGISISEGKVHSILKDLCLSKHQERLSLQMNRYKNGKILSELTIKDMESPDAFFKYRSCVSAKLGQTVFMWEMSGKVSHTKQKTRFLICLDMCGCTVMIYANLDYFYIDYHAGIDFNRMAQDFNKHAYTDPYKQIMNKYFRIFDREPKQLILEDTGYGFQLFQEQISEFCNTEVYQLEPAHFYSNPYVDEFFSHFKKEFLNKQLKLINHRRITRSETGENIRNYLRDFLIEYNNSLVVHFPNLGLSPYEYVSQMENRKIYLPSFKEYLSFIHKRREKEDKENSNKSIIDIKGNYHYMV